VSDLPEDRKQKLYERLYYSAKDFVKARECACHLLKKGWHAAPYERRGSIYMQQSAFVTALVISYARPFTKSYGWPSFPSDLAQLDQDNLRLHKQLIDLRNKVYAHSDSQYHKVEPFRIGSQSIAHILGEPFYRLTRAECEQIISMIDTILNRLRPQLAQMSLEIADS
jgi:hypothetical protein